MESEPTVDSEGRLTSSANPWAKRVWQYFEEMAAIIEGADMLLWEAKGRVLE